MLSERLLPEREMLPELEQLNYEIIEWIPTKSNGMARLVKARSRTGDLVAIKIARVAKEDALTAKHNLAILAEATCLHRLSQCPGVVPIRPIINDPTLPVTDVTTAYCGTLNEEGSPTYLVQPFLSGSTLDRFVGQHPVDPIVALQIIHQLALTLDWVHDSNWVHRDLKPSNVIIDGDVAHQPKRQNGSKSKDRVQGNEAAPHGPTLIDFGIAVPKDEKVVAEGTLSWMAPEVRQAFEENYSLSANPACDLYGLGLLFCYMLSGQRPDVSQSTSHNRQVLLDGALQAIRNSTALKTKTIKKLSRLLHQLLDENPRNRPSAYDTHSQVSELLYETHHLFTWPKRFFLPKKRNRTLLWRVAGSLLVALVSILMGQWLLQTTTQNAIQEEQAALAVRDRAGETVADALATPAAKFPSAHEAPTATLQPAMQAASRSGVEAQGEADADTMVARTSAAAVGDLSGAPVDAEASILDWLPQIQLPSLQSLFASSSPALVPTLVPNVMPTLSPTPPSTPPSTPTPSPPSTPLQGSDAALANSQVAPAAQLPETAKILEVIGDQYSCKEHWRQTDTWSKSVRGSRINLRWQQVGTLPFGAEARYVVAVSTDEKQLTAQDAIPITAALTGDGVDIDAVKVFWAMNRVLPQNQIANRPFVWGIFLLDRNDQLATRVSPICYFQLDGEIARSVLNE